MEQFYRVGAGYDIFFDLPISFYAAENAGQFQSFSASIKRAASA